MDNDKFDKWFNFSMAFAVLFVVIGGVLILGVGAWAVIELVQWVTTR